LSCRAAVQQSRERAAVVNILKVIDVPVAAALAAQRNPVRVVARDVEAWKYPRMWRKLAWRREFELAVEEK